MHEVQAMKGRIGLRVAALVLPTGCVLAACGGQRSSTSSAKQASDLLNQGLQAQVQGDTSAATAKFDAVLKVDPKNKFAYYNLGLIEQKANNKAKAETNYRTGDRDRPELRAGALQPRDHPDRGRRQGRGDHALHPRDAGEPEVRGRVPEPRPPAPRRPARPRRPTRRSRPRPGSTRSWPAGSRRTPSRPAPDRGGIRPSLPLGGQPRDDRQGPDQRTPRSTDPATGARPARRRRRRRAVPTAALPRLAHPSRLAQAGAAPVRRDPDRVQPDRPAHRAAPCRAAQRHHGAHLDGALGRATAQRRPARLRRLVPEAPDGPRAVPPLPEPPAHHRGRVRHGLRRRTDGRVERRTCSSPSGRSASTGRSGCSASIAGPRRRPRSSRR